MPNQPENECLVQVREEMKQRSADINDTVQEVHKHFANDGPAAKRGWSKFVSQANSRWLQPEQPFWLNTY